jgi:hypothetical protein
MSALEPFELVREWSYFEGAMDSYVGGENKSNTVQKHPSTCASVISM